MEKRNWTKEDFIELARPRIQAGFANPSIFAQELGLFFSEAGKHYDSATEDGKNYLDNALEGLAKLLERGLQSAPDTPDTRKMRRSVSLVRRKHFLAKDLIEVFETIKPSSGTEWISRALEVFTSTIQTLLDIMYDVTRVSQTGAVSLARVGLFYWLIDELIAAQSLARRNHSTLAYAHLRCTMEILDKIELFGERPELAELWMSGDEHEVWKKLAPPRVREMLTRPAFDPKRKSYDPLYEYLSEQGAHSTFTALRSRFQARRDEGGNLGIAFIIGGMSLPSRETSILMYCVMLANLAIIRSVSSFPGFLNLDEVVAMVTTVSDKTFNFFGQFMDQVDQGDYDQRPLEILMAAWRHMRDAGPETGEGDAAILPNSSQA